MYSLCLSCTLQETLCNFSRWPADFFCLFRQRGAGASSVRLGRHQYGCLHSAGSAALEELHLPAKTDREYNRRPSSPRGRRWRRETHKCAAKGNDVIFSKRREPHSRSKMCWCHIFTHPGYCPVSIMFWFMLTQHYANQFWLPGSRTVASLCAESVFWRTIRPFGHQAGASTQSDSQGRSTIRPIIDNNRVQFSYSDSDFGLYPLSACLPRGLKPRHRRFKRRGGRMQQMGKLF